MDARLRFLALALLSLPVFAWWARSGPALAPCDPFLWRPAERIGWLLLTLAATWLLRVRRGGPWRWSRFFAGWAAGGMWLGLPLASLFLITGHTAPVVGNLAFYALRSGMWAAQAATALGALGVGLALVAQAGLGSLVHGAGLCSF